MFGKVLKNPKTYLLIIIVLSFLLRIIKIDNPVADWHSWRQADTAAVARNFYKNGFNPFIPRYDDMSGVAEYPVFNPEKYRFVEFPIYNSIVYFTYLLNGRVDEFLARLVSVIISLGSLVFVYLITKKYFSTFTALIAAFLFGVLPFNVYFSRVILPEPLLVFFSLGMLYFGALWMETNSKKYFWWSVFFNIAGLLTKPYAVFYLLPLMYVYFKKEKLWPIPKKYLIWFGLSCLPLLFWRLWINQHPEGIPASKWLLNGNHIRFKPVFWQWIIQDRLGREILTVFGSILFAIGVLVRPKLKETSFLHIFALSNLLFLIIFATGNVQHDYYQTFIVPALVIFMARGFVLMWEGLPNLQPRFWTIPFSLLFLFMTIYTGWEQVKGFYQINNNSIVKAGKLADKILPKNASVVANYQGDTSFLYQTNRAGFPNVPLPIKDLHDWYHVDYFISVAKDAKTKWVMRKYHVLVDTSEYVIVDLTKENPGFDAVNDIEPS